MDKSKKTNKPPIETFDFECILRDKNGSPICYIRNENNQRPTQNQKNADQYQGHKYSILKNLSNLHYKGVDASSRDFMENLLKQNQEIIDQLEKAKFMDHFNSSKEGEEMDLAKAQKEFEEPEESEIKPLDNPDKEFEFPKQDEILDDEPLREIEDPVEPEFDPKRNIPKEGEFPGAGSSTHPEDLPENI